MYSDKAYIPLETEDQYVSVLGTEKQVTYYKDGVPQGWFVVVIFGLTKEVTKKYVGLSASDAASVVALNPPSIQTSRTEHPVETFSRKVKKSRIGDTNLFNVTIVERSTQIIED